MTSVKRRVHRAMERFALRQRLPVARQDSARSRHPARPARPPHRAGERIFPRSGVFQNHTGESAAAPPHLSFAKGVDRRVQHGRGIILLRDHVSRRGPRRTGRSFTPRISIPNRSAWPRRACIRSDRIQLFTQNHQKSGGKSSLSEYYTAAYDHARFDPALRSRAVFSDHSLVTDEVFAEVHLISCRNVMIYFDRALQDRALGPLQGRAGTEGFSRPRRQGKPAILEARERPLRISCGRKNSTRKGA